MIRWSAHLSTLFGEYPPLERPAAAAAAGFEAVETWWPPADDPDEWVGAVNDAGLTVALVNADGGDLTAGERGFCHVPERRDEVIGAVEAAARVAVACGGGAVNLLVGRHDGRRTRTEQLAVARDTVRAAADRAAKLGARIVIEHLNGLEVNRPLIATPGDALRFVAAVDHPAVGVLFDAYHAAMIGRDPGDEFARVADRVGHVQYADCPGRGDPGSGRIDLAGFVNRLAARGYDGYVGLEFLPQGSTAAALARLPQPPGG